jgi:hypothetical protein
MIELTHEGPRLGGSRVEPRGYLQGLDGAGGPSRVANTETPQQQPGFEGSR